MAVDGQSARCRVDEHDRARRSRVRQAGDVAARVVRYRGPIDAGLGDAVEGAVVIVIHPALRRPRDETVVRRPLVVSEAAVEAEIAQHGAAAGVVGQRYTGSGLVIRHQLARAATIRVVGQIDELLVGQEPAAAAVEGIARPLRVAW